MPNQHKRRLSHCTQPGHAAVGPYWKGLVATWGLGLYSVPGKDKSSTLGPCISQRLSIEPVTRAHEAEASPCTQVANKSDLGKQNGASVGIWTMAQMRARDLETQRQRPSPPA